MSLYVLIKDLSYPFQISSKSVFFRNYFKNFLTYETKFHIYNLLAAPRGYTHAVMKHGWLIIKVAYRLSCTLDNVYAKFHNDWSSSYGVKA